MRLARLRRISQLVFLALFAFLLARSGVALGGLLAYPAGLILQLDPLTALVNALSTGALYRGLLWSLAILIPTLLLGRFFCGWICPLGTLNHWIGNWKSEAKRGASRIASNRYRKWQAWKYHLLIAILVAAASGSGIAGWLDPIALLVRSLALSILPAVNYALDAALDPLARSDWIAARYAAAAGNFLFRDTLLAFRQPYFSQGVLLGAILVSILALNLRVTRFWCRALCPLGALLGVCSRWALPRLEKRVAACKDCNLCVLHCQGGDDPLPGAPWRKAECHLCMNCVAACPNGSLAFCLHPAGAREAPDIGKRRAVGALAAGVAAVPLMRTTVSGQERRIRPPGALEERDFLARCIRCGACMKVCGNNALQPAFSEAGLEGLWTPVLAARTGYCEPSCTLCGQACPTGAIWDFTLQQKGWIGGASTQPIRIGTAFYDRGRCLPWAMSTECIVCEEWCPVTPKAVVLRTVETPNGPLRRPYIDPSRCVGCGACEYACPVKDRPAVYVTPIGESRARNRHFLLTPGAKTGSLFCDASGWTRTGATRVFTPATLAQFIDGDAERFLQAGIEETLVQDYRYGRSDAAASIYLMPSPAAARRIFENESAAGSQPLAVGNAARNYGLSITFLKGRYFVRLVAYDEAPLIELARALAGRM